MTSAEALPWLFLALELGDSVFCPIKRLPRVLSLNGDSLKFWNEDTGRREGWGNRGSGADEQ